jgi:hypothetical protein
MGGMTGPGRRSWIDRLVDVVDRAPGPAWLAYLVLAVAGIAVGSGIAWTDGTVPAGELRFVRVFTDATYLYQLGILHLLVRSARSSLSSFAPALGGLAPQRDAYEQRLTSVPLWISLVAIPAGLGYAASFLLGDPGGVGLEPASSLALWIFVSVGTILSGIFFAALVLVVLRAMVIIVELHSRADRVSIFDAPAHGAFARYTLRASVGLALPVYVFTTYQLLTGNPEGRITAPEIVTVVGSVGGAIAVFAIPLVGIHRRLVRQKSELVAANLARIAEVGRDIHAAVDAGALEGAGERDSLLSALSTERDILRRLSTWPWEGETLRGFVSSIALPIAIWLATELIRRALG